MHTIPGFLAAVMTPSLFSARGMTRLCTRHVTGMTRACPGNATVNASELTPQM